MNISKFQTNPLSQSPERGMVYFPALDGLRTLAVFLVILTHFDTPGLNNFKEVYFDTGRIGVELFFVLSGYLVGGILIRQKIGLAESGKIGLRQVFYKFTMRRLLRILPPYYFLLVILVLINYPSDISKYIYWLFGYGTNIFMLINNRAIWPLNPFWTLAVEEQFYIILPILVLIPPKKYIKYTIFILIISGIVCRIVAPYLNFNIIYTQLMLPLCFPAFGLGILVAWYQIVKDDWLLPYKTILFWFAVGIFVLVSLPELRFNGSSILFFALPFVPFCFALIIDGITRNQIPSIINNFLTRKWMVSLGKISYGIYLYHNVAYFAMIDFLKDHAIQLNSWITFTIGTILTLAISYTSYYLLERPIMSLKRYF